MHFHLQLHCVRLTIKILLTLTGNVGVFTRCRVDIGTLGRKAHDLFGKRESSTCRCGHLATISLELCIVYRCPGRMKEENNLRYWNCWNKKKERNRIGQGEERAHACIVAFSLQEEYLTVASSIVFKRTNWPIRWRESNCASSKSKVFPR